MYAIDPTLRCSPTFQLLEAKSSSSRTHWMRSTTSTLPICPRSPIPAASWGTKLDWRSRTGVISWRTKEPIGQTVEDLSFRFRQAERTTYCRPKCVLQFDLCYHGRLWPRRGHLKQRSTPWHFGYAMSSISVRIPSYIAHIRSLETRCKC